MALGVVEVADPYPNPFHFLPTIWNIYDFKRLFDSRAVLKWHITYDVDNSTSSLSADCLCLLSRLAVEQYWFFSLSFFPPTRRKRTADETAASGELGEEIEARKWEPMRHRNARKRCEFQGLAWKNVQGSIGTRGSGCTCMFLAGQSDWKWIHIVY